VVLREGGEAALTIDRLCKDLGRTKGAFYHHFADVAVYTDALLSEWEDHNTSIPLLRTEPAAARRGKRGTGAATPVLDASLDRSFRAWGLRDPKVREFIDRIDERRIAYLASLYAAEISVAQRRKLARLEYAAFIGMQQLYPELPRPAVRELERTLHGALDTIGERRPRRVGATTAPPTARGRAAPVGSIAGSRKRGRSPGSLPRQA
jgi:AcrR family transcriptional regulator